MSSRQRTAFTLIEVLASVLVLVLGFAAAIGMILYGFQLAKISMGRATAMATAMSVAVDPTPMQPSNPMWTPAVPGTTTGYLNSYYIKRTESDPSVIARNASGVPVITTADVDVDVYETFKGKLIASYSTRLVKGAPSP